MKIRVTDRAAVFDELEERMCWEKHMHTASSCTEMQRNPSLVTVAKQPLIGGGV